MYVTSTIDSSYLYDRRGKEKYSDNYFKITITCIKRLFIELYKIYMGFFIVGKILHLKRILLHKGLSLSLVLNILL